MRSIGRITILLSLLFVSSAAVAQDDAYVPAGPESAEPIKSTVDFGAVDELLAQDEEVLSDPTVHSYDPGTRRDPFRSLLKKKTNRDLPAEQRPSGIAGLLIDEVEVDGIFIMENGPVAQVQSASQETSFLLRPGDQLWDGDVVRITLDEIQFKQTVNDPTSLKPFRDVVKRLNPSEGQN
jgi:hypothetical protein